MKTRTVGSHPAATTKNHRWLHEHTPKTVNVILQERKCACHHNRMWFKSSPARQRPNHSSSDTVQIWGNECSRRHTKMAHQVVLLTCFTLSSKLGSYLWLRIRLRSVLKLKSVSTSPNPHICQWIKKRNTVKLRRPKRRGFSFLFAASQITETSFLIDSAVQVRFCTERGPSRNSEIISKIRGYPSLRSTVQYTTLHSAWPFGNLTS